MVFIPGESQGYVLVNHVKDEYHHGVEDRDQVLSEVVADAKEVHVALVVNHSLKCTDRQHNENNETKCRTRYEAGYEHPDLPLKIGKAQFVSFASNWRLYHFAREPLHLVGRSSSHVEHVPRQSAEQRQ